MQTVLPCGFRALTFGNSVSKSFVLNYSNGSIDFYGGGRSACPRVQYTVELFVQQVADLLKYLGLDDEPFVMVGSSMGGLISTTFSSQYPELVKQLILINPAGVPIPTMEHLKYVAFFSCSFADVSNQRVD